MRVSASMSWGGSEEQVQKEEDRTPLPSPEGSRSGRERLRSGEAPGQYEARFRVNLLPAATVWSHANCYLPCTYEQELRDALYQAAEIGGGSA